MSFPELVTPETVSEAVELMSNPRQKTLIFGGGTLVQPLMTLGTDAFDVVIDLDELEVELVGTELRQRLGELEVDGFAAVAAHDNGDLESGHGDVTFRYVVTGLYRG